MPKSKKPERFPLILHHATKERSKCITLPSGRRRSVYFGTDRDGALAKYLKEREDWQAGRDPREVTTALTVLRTSKTSTCRPRQRGYFRHWMPTLNLVDCHFLDNLFNPQCAGSAPTFETHESYPRIGEPHGVLDD